MALSGPEHTEVRLPIVAALEVAGWSKSQLQWQPEWRVPKSPSESQKRENGRSFDGWPVDLVLFQDTDQANDWQNVLGIFEFKAPDQNTGLSQLEIYLLREPRARFGVWTNGTSSAMLYKLPDGTFKTVLHKEVVLPSPDDDFELATTKAITFNDLVEPSEQELKASFEALLDVVVARDSVATRSEMHLDQLCNLLLLKLESDTNASLRPAHPVAFQLRSDEGATAAHIRSEFDQMVTQREEVFRDEHGTALMLDDHTIKEVVFAWSGWNLLEMKAEAVSSAFQVFRRANLKAGEGQYYTPARIIRSAVKLMDLQPADKIIDPACGTGGFLVEAFRQMSSTVSNEARLRTWAHRNVYGVDKDSINVKLTRAMMMVMGDGSAHVHIGDSLREDRWVKDYPHMPAAMRDETFTVVMTNPPFGENLKITARDCEANKYSISLASGKGKTYKDIEIGLVFLERAYRLLKAGGRLAIILPETYFFSPSYTYFWEWMDERFIRRGEFNIPMEAFQGFCRAKTNLYVLEKKD
ncbi:putative type I restriction enzymeP M protein (plasmid) [Corynebacterium faecale]|uniref:HsdM family class I SAM-dependent methyltransferase n=1 Tax=Corynebacterium faecale TaxID=1758466 RepID=UPI0025B2A432|nr:N-6 DNA methylase [Corynebacterium faecale]WJY93530.1 putative type I restriction enzymeP M protein [Corynebacterium faecale]